MRRLLVLLAVAVFGVDAYAAPPTFTPIGTLGLALPGGAVASSDDGWTIVGRIPGPASNVSEAFRWTLPDGLAGLGDLPGSDFYSAALDVSADGSVVVGHGRVDGSDGYTEQAFRWTAANGVMVGLGYLSSQILYSAAYGVSADGSVVVGEAGALGPTSSGVEAFRWTAATGMVGLGDLAGGEYESTAFAVSADGSTVVGSSSSASGRQAFRWTSSTGMVGLGTVSGGSESRHVSADGSVVVGTAGGVAFRWTEASGRVSLGGLPGPLNYSNPGSISADGSIIVGYATNFAISKPFIWDETHGMRELQQLLTDFGIDLTGWNLWGPFHVSADGQTIVGVGTNPAGQTELWRATIPPLAATACDDEYDNDGDGLADLLDPGCADAADDSEREASLQCDDGLDNDGDGLIDFPGDIGCKSLTHVENPQCQDGIDNDADGKIDFDGGASVNGGTPLGTVDPGCEGKSFRNSEATSSSCGLGAEIALVFALFSRWARRRTTR